MKRSISFIKILLLLIIIVAGKNVIAQRVTDATWSTKASEYNTNTGQRYTLYFPPNGFVTGTIWGTGVYTTDCSIAGAAVHAGLITSENGGTVTIEMLPGQTAYQGSTYNGITSYNWGSFNSSFMFVNTKRLQNRV